MAISVAQSIRASDGCSNIARASQCMALRDKQDLQLRGGGETIVLHEILEHTSP